MPSTGNLIEANDFNVVANLFNSVLGTGIGFVPTGRAVFSSDWVNLVNTVNNQAANAGFQLNPVPDPNNFAQAHLITADVISALSSTQFIPLTINLSIGGNTRDLNIFSFVLANYGFPPPHYKVNITVNGDVVIGASGTGGPAMFIGGGWDSTTIINIINFGFIVGCGGNGAQAVAGTNGGVPGGNGGGVAMVIEWSSTINNQGTIGGGGGGGGAGGITNNSGQSYDDYTGAGGGGAGDAPGQGGIGASNSFSTNPGGNGNLTGGGGGSGFWSSPGSSQQQFGSVGGDGGSLGNGGGTGQAGGAGGGGSGFAISGFGSVLSYVGNGPLGPIQ